MSEPTDGHWPLVSVAVITRNRAASLSRTLEALGKLSYPNYEVIVVDNGSTDETSQVVGGFPVRYIRGSAKDGISLSRQRGIEAAKGKIVAMCDDDCVPRPDWLEHFSRRFLSDDLLALLGGQTINIGFPGSRRFKGQTKLGANGSLSFLEDPEEAEFFGNGNLAVRKNLVEKVGGYDPFLKAGREEIDLTMSLRGAGYRIDFEPKAVLEHFYTGISFKRGRWFFDNHLMRLYFFFKHQRPHSISEWFRFARYETRLLGKDLLRALRMFAGAVLRWKPRRLPSIMLDLCNLVTARLAIPWLLWRAQPRLFDRTAGTTR